MVCLLSGGPCRRLRFEVGRCPTVAGRAAVTVAPGPSALTAPARTRWDGVMPVLLSSLDPLVAALRGDGFRVVGPTVRDGAIVLAELESAQALPSGWGVTLSPGGYRLRERGDRAAFGHAAGPQSWKSYL